MHRYTQFYSDFGDSDPFGQLSFYDFGQCRQQMQASGVLQLSFIPSPFVKLPTGTD